MTRIPVLATIRDAYRFAIANLGAIIGQIWLPMVIVSVSGFFAAQHYYVQMAEAVTAPAQADSAILLLLLQTLVSLVLSAVMWVAITQLALGNPSTSPMPFAFGRVEMRLTRALLGLALMTMVFFLLVGVALAGVGPTASMPVVEIGAVLALYGAMLFVVPRLVFFAAVAAAMEEGPVLARAWSLSQGNFWRILAVLVGVLGPILLLFVIAVMVMLGPVVAADNTLANQVAVLRRAREILPMMQGLIFLISPLLLGLPLGASVSAWRTLTRKSVEIFA